MPSRTSLVAFASVAALGLATGCEKQNPYITLTAGGVVVKAKAVRYCRAADDCRETKDVPTLKIKSGDTLGIDVPRSLAEQGWRLGEQGEFSNQHYRSIPIGPGVQSGTLRILRNEEHGYGEWRFNIEVVQE